jgi:type IV pilus assembly protein PilW
MKKYVAKMTSKRGYTIVELLVAIAISGIFMGSIYSVYTTQQRATLGQEQVSAMQRNLRSAMYYMEKEIRMAGCDPTGRAGARIETAQNDGFRFTLDITDDTGTDSPDGDVGDAGESIGYYRNAGGDLFRDLTDDGDDTNGIRIAENIDAINFVYLDKDGNNLADDGLGNVTDPENRARIRSVQVTVVARTGKKDPRYTDSTSYQNKIPETIFTPSGDAVRFRRKLLSTSIKCRNLGL